MLTNKEKKKIDKLIAKIEIGSYGIYDLTYMRTALKRLHEIVSPYELLENKHSKKIADLFLQIYIINLKIETYLHRSFRPQKTVSDCGLFQKELINKVVSSATTSINDLIQLLEHGVCKPTAVHLTFRYTKNTNAGHFFTLLLRPNRQPYILQEDKNGYTFRQYITYNILRGIKNPLSKDPKKLITFLRDANELKRVKRSHFVYLFGFLWIEDEEIPISNIKVVVETIPDSRYSLESLSMD